MRKKKRFIWFSMTSLSSTTQAPYLYNLISCSLFNVLAALALNLSLLYK